MIRISSLAILSAAGTLFLGNGSDASAQAAQLYPAFCQGISVESGDNRMFISKTFGYPQKNAPEGGTLQEGTSGAEFAREVKRRSGKDLIDSVCYTRPSAQEIADFAESTVRSNGSGWTVETLDWMPKGARPLSAAVDEASASAGDTGAPARPATEAEVARAARAQRLSDEQRIEAERVREINARHLAAAQEQTRKNEEIKRAHETAKQANDELQRSFQQQQRAFLEQQQAYQRAKAEQEAKVRAAEAAHRQWVADVAACKAGDRSRCGTE